METVYLETSIIGYLAMRPSGLLRVAANQQMTNEWWEQRRQAYQLLASRFVVDECSAGDPVAAEERLEFLEGIELLEVADAVDELAELLLAGVPLPERAAVDAYHISISAVHGVKYLLTWNCKHIANASMRRQIERICRDSGYEALIMCTPQELLELEDVQ